MAVGDPQSINSPNTKDPYGNDFHWVDDPKGGIGSYQPGTAPQGQSANGLGGAANGAAAGSAAGPWGAVIGAVVGLLSAQKQAQEANRAQKLEYQLGEHAKAQNNVQRYQENQLQTASNMGPREQSAIGQLIGVFNSARR